MKEFERMMMTEPVMKPIEPAEDAFCREREAYERLQAENTQLRERIGRAYAMLKGEAYNPIPSLITIRAVCDMLRNL